MRKRKPFKGTILKRKATNAAKQSLYLAMWGAEAPSKCRKTGNFKNIFGESFVEHKPYSKK